MHSYQIVAGFSEIKTELRKQANLSKSLDELHLWFSFEENVLYVHDFDDHKKSMELGVYNEKERTWSITFKGKAYGRQVIEYAINKFRFNSLDKDFQQLYFLYGYIRL